MSVTKESKLPPVRVELVATSGDYDVASALRDFRSSVDNLMKILAWDISETTTDGTVADQLTLIRALHEFEAFIESSIKLT